MLSFHSYPIHFSENEMQDLYGAGAKKFSMVSPSLVGCCPSQRAIAHDPKNPRDIDDFGCLAAANNLSRQLQPMLAAMLQGLGLELRRMNYSLGDAVGMAEFVFKSPSTPAYSNQPKPFFVVWPPMHKPLSDLRSF